MLYWYFGTVYLASVFGALITMGISNSYSNGRILEMGYELQSMKNNSIIKNIKYFFYAYGSSFIPVYNFLDSIEKASQADSALGSIRRKYDSKRIKILCDSGLAIKPEEKNELSKEEKINVEEKTDNKKEETMIKAKTLDEMTCYERREFYRNEYEKACRECEIENLKTEKSDILSSMEKPIKLIRK